jgi:hypothetical protein
MESLQQNTTRDFHDIIRDSDIDATLQGILAADKVPDLQLMPEQLGKELGEPVNEVRDILWWAADRYDQAKLLSYLHEFDYTSAQMVTALDQAKTTEQREAWQEKYGDWHRRPSIDLRYAQLVALKSKQEALQQTYPEIELRLLARKDATISQLMPSFGPNDTSHNRVTNPATPLAQIYHGGVGVDPRLLQAMRGRITSNPQGIDFYKTPYGELHRRASLFEDDGLCLIGKHPVSYELIKEMELAQILQRALRSRSTVACVLVMI